MSKTSDLELEERLAGLEEDLGPTLRKVWGDARMRSEFAAGLGRQLASHDSVGPRPRLTVLRGRVWSAAAAVLVGGVVLGFALFANRPQPVSAADVVGQLQNEAFGMSVGGTAGCLGGKPQVTGGAVVAVSSAGTGAPAAGPVAVGNPNDLSERLAQALGVSGDKVRQAMLATVQAELPGTPPPDPMASIATQLGMPRDQVCAAFFDQASSQSVVVTRSVTGSGEVKSSGSGPVVKIAVPGETGAIDLTTVAAEQLSGPAQRLGISPDRLLAAVRAAIPALEAAPTPPLPNPDAIISRFAQNLGMSESKVRAAITQVEGNQGFYFAVPLPGLGR